MTDPLLSHLAAVLGRVDPVPAHLIADARAALGLARVPDGCRLLEPVAGESILVRSGSQAFRFAGKEISVEVRLSRLPWGVRLDGFVAPSAEVEVHWPTGARTALPDAAGLFRVDDLPGEPLRVVVGSVVTPWFWP